MLQAVVSIQAGRGPAEPVIERSHVQRVEASTEGCDFLTFRLRVSVPGTTASELLLRASSEEERGRWVHQLRLIRAQTKPRSPPARKSSLRGRLSRRGPDVAPAAPAAPAAPPAAATAPPGKFANLKRRLSITRMAPPPTSV